MRSNDNKYWSEFRISLQSIKYASKDADEFKTIFFQFKSWRMEYLKRRRERLAVKLQETQVFTIQEQISQNIDIFMRWGRNINQDIIWQNLKNYSLLTQFSIWFFFFKLFIFIPNPLPPNEKIQFQVIVMFFVMLILKIYIIS